MILPELQGKIKSLKETLASREVYTILLIIFVGFASFGLGRLSRLEELREPIRIEQQIAAVILPPRLSKEGTGGVVKSPLTKGVPPSSEAGVVSPGGQLVASRTGTKYHFPWCSGAQRISEANKFWFNSIEEARKAGYTPALNCKGLK